MYGFIVTVRSDYRRFLVIISFTIVFALLLVTTPFQRPAHAQGSIGTCPVYPADNAWNLPVTNWPVDPNSTNYVNSVGATAHLHPDFGSDPTYGIPFDVVHSNTQASVSITYDVDGGAADESDAGPFPIPPTAHIEGGTNADGDRHVLVVDEDQCMLYELDEAHKNTGDNNWHAYSGAKWDLNSDALRPDGWTSADAAGLPIFPGLVRYDEVTAGAIQHALRFTVANTQNKYVYPARHEASNKTNPNYPPMGLRFRMKASYDISGFTGESLVIAQALKTYGMMVADNGSNWYISGEGGDGNGTWDDDDLDQLKTIPGSAFEVVDMPPFVPTGLSATAVSQTEIDLHWTDNAFDESTYNVERSLDGAHWTQFTTQAPNTTSLQSILLDCGTQYYYRVRAFRASDGAYSDYSNVANATTSACSLGSVSLTAPTDGILTNNNAPLFSWTTGSGATSYEMQFDTNSDFSSLKRDSIVNTTSGSPNPLLDGTTYYWRVRGLASSNTQAGPWSASRIINIDRIRLAPPSLTAPANASNVAILTPTFTWGTVTGAVHYQLQVDDDPAFGSPLPIATLGKVVSYVTKATDGLLYGKTYYWRMQAQDASNVWSNWSSTRTFTVTNMKTPTNGAYSTSVNPMFSWSAVTGATDYKLEVSSDPDFAVAHIEATAHGTALLTYTVPSLLDGTHYWHVIVTTPSGIFTMQPWTLIVTPSLPTAPVLIGPATGSPFATNTTTLSWNNTTAPSGGPFSYQVQVATASTFLGPLQDTVQSGTTYPVLLLPADGVYYWRVRPINNFNTTGPWSAVRNFSVDTTPPPVPVLTAPKNWSGTTATKVTLTWGAAVGAKTYTVQIFQADCSTSVSTVPVTTPSYAATLTTGMYCWNVTAADALGNTSAASANFHFTVNPTGTTPGIPTLSLPLTGSVYTPAGLIPLQWNGTGFSGDTFEVQVDTASTFPHPIHDLVSAPDDGSYTISPLLPSGLYYWHVRAINPQGIAGAYSTARTFTIQSTAPVAPTLLTPAQNSSITSLHPVLKWQAVTNAKTYILQVATDSGFASLIVNNKSFTAPTVSYTMATEVLSYASIYYWRVEALDAAGNTSPWSTPFQFTVSVHMAPANFSGTTLTKPTFQWMAVTGAFYHLQVASDLGFTHVVAHYDGPLTRYTVPSALSLGSYYWHVSFGGTTMPTWTLVVTTTPPGIPVLSGPATNAVTNDNTPTFTWKAATNTLYYEVEIDTTSTFTGPQVDVMPLLYTPSSLPDGKYYWRVRAANGFGITGAWSAPWIITIDTQAPAAPTLLGPANNTTTTNPNLTLRWNASVGAVKYEVALDTQNPPQSPPIPLGNVLTFLIPSPHAQGDYYWEVRAIDTAGNVSGWSSVYHFTLAAGMSSQSVKPTPTFAPPTNTPSAPTASPVQLVTVEAESNSVQQTGSWTAQATTKASGGSYVYSNDASGDELTLGFSGSHVDIVFVEHPDFGSFAVEVDGQVVQSVDEKSEQTTFGAQISLDNLGAGPHILKVYTVQGTIALDAFRVQAVNPTPTS